MIETAEATTTLVLADNTAVPQTLGLPKAITPANTASPANNYKLVTVGFREALNYPFVVSHSILSAQIFDYLPDVLKFPFNGNAAFDDIAVNRIVPFGSQDVNYIISVAEVYFPEEDVDSLQQLLSDSSSKLYQNKDPTTAMLALLIDVRVPLTGLNTASRPTTPGPVDNGSVGSSDAKSSNSGVVAGIAAGASMGLLAYMALMVLMFRKFKKRSVELQSDLESQVESGYGSSNGSTGSPVSLSTAKFQISVPVAAQNSLGWSE